MSLRTLWERWKILAEKIGNFQARAILTLFYFTIFLIPALIVLLFKDVLGQEKMESYWSKRGDVNDTIEEAQKLW